MKYRRHLVSGVPADKDLALLHEMVKSSEEKGKDRARSPGLWLGGMPAGLLRQHGGYLFWLKDGNMAPSADHGSFALPCWFSLVTGTSINSSQIYCGMSW